MGITGLGTYSTSFYYKMTSQGNNTNVNDKFDLGLVLNWNPKFQFANFTSSFDNPLQE